VWAEHLRRFQGYNIELGTDCFINYNVTIMDEAKGMLCYTPRQGSSTSADNSTCSLSPDHSCRLIIIGRDTLIAPDVKIYNHASHPDERLRDDDAEMGYRFPVTIGSRCWIGGGATILPGVTIGNSAAVAAGAVVTKDVEERCLVAGVPARVVKRYPRES
jgi:acetyltransferase-like isoleucine patch superfamily enzyme